MPANRFVEALKKCLRARGMTYAALARELRISEASVKRMFSRSSFTLSRIEEILAALDLDLHEVARMSLASAAGPAELALDQETALAKDERLISVFWLVLNGWRYEQIAEAFSISRAELTLVFARLDRLRLIEWGKGERARLRFDSPLELLRFETRQLSPESAVVLKRRLERLVAEFNEFAELDSAVPGSRRVGVALLAACRPWEFSVVNALKRRRSA